MVIAPGAFTPSVADGHIYWTDGDRDSNVAKVPVSGGLPVSLAIRTTGPVRFAVVGQKVFWGDLVGGGPAGIRSFDRADDSVARLFELPQCTGADPGPFVIDNENIYWALACGANSITGNVDTIMKIPLDGTPAVTLVTTPYLGEIRTVQSITIDASHVYWAENASHTTNSSLRRISKNGGTIQDLVVGLNKVIGNLALTGTLAVFAETDFFGTYRLMKVPVTGGSPTVLATITAQTIFDYLKALSVDTNNIYWVEDTKVKSVPLAGGSPTDLAVGQNKATALVLTDTSVFWIEVSGVGPPGRINKVSKAGGTAMTLLDDLNAPRSLVEDSGTLYWNELNPAVEGSERLAAAPVSGGPISTVFSGVARDKPPFAVDGQFLYVGDGHVIEKLPRTGGLPETLARSSDVITNVVTDGSFVYWAEEHAVRKVSVNGGPVTDLSSFTGKERMYSVSVANGNAYWIESTSFEDSIRRHQLNGGGAATILSGVTGLIDLLADDTHVYVLQGGPNIASIKKMSIIGGPLTPFVSGAGAASMCQDTTHLYWINQTEVGRISKATGAAELYESGIRPRGGITVDESSVYWYADEVIWKATPK